MVRVYFHGNEYDKNLNSDVTVFKLKQTDSNRFYGSDDRIIEIDKKFKNMLEEKFGNVVSITDKGEMVTLYNKYKPFRTIEGGDDTTFFYNVAGELVGYFFSMDDNGNITETLEFYQDEEEYEHHNN